MRQRALITGGLAIGEVERSEGSEKSAGRDQLDAGRKLVRQWKRTGWVQQPDKIGPLQGPRHNPHQCGQRLLGERLVVVEPVAEGGGPGREMLAEIRAAR